MKQHQKSIIKLLIMISIYLLLIGSSKAQTSLVIISGLPIKKDMSDIEGTEQIELSKSEQWNYRLEIVRKGNKYYWASRENKELLFSKSGEIYNFVEPKAAGYIRIVKTQNGILYMEHLTNAMQNITYWGVAIESSLP